MKQGKHVYCEKPLTRTVYEARVMRAVADKHKVVTQMGNQGSASEGVRRAAEWAWAGTPGPIREAYLWVGDGGKKPMTRPEGSRPIPEGLTGTCGKGLHLSAPTTRAICREHGEVGDIMAAADLATWGATRGTLSFAVCALSSFGRTPPIEE